MVSSSLVRTLVGLVVQRDWFFEGCDDEVLDPDDAVKQLEWSAYVLGGLSETDRRAFLAVLAELTAEETDPGLRELMESYGEDTGLTDLELPPPAWTPWLWM
ncbi:hypothetical protein ABGB12_34675 [Actinocorallia sp. B10E7]|uniref:hypothetical protein n=1 Tax=Actinocorallia sp. B10E7 TaxID=3153558 RepID=UPI00325CD221